MDVVWFLVGDNNDKNDGFRWQQYRGEFQHRSNKGLTRLASGKARWPSLETPSEPSYDCSFKKNMTEHRP